MWFSANRNAVREGAAELNLRNRLTTIRSRFLGDESGTVAMLFGLMAMVMFMLVGAAVDFGRWLKAREQTVIAMDSAVMAAGRALQVSSLDQAGALKVANTYYQSGVQNRLKVKSDTISFQIADNGTAVIAKGNATIATPFLGVCCGTSAIRELPLLKASGDDYSRAVLTVGSNAQTNLETSVIVDLSGSMAGQKILDLKAAAKDLVNIIVWANQGKYTSKVALVPYGIAVNAGPYADIARGKIAAGTCTKPGCEYFTFTNSYEQPNTFAVSTCVSERTGPEAYTDASPRRALVGMQYAGPYNPCLPSKVVPLSNDKEMLLGQIDALQAAGSTGGQVGIAWGWYMLSPHWNSVWPSTSYPAPYNEMSALNAQGKPKLKKIAVIMTDGEYNSPYCNGVIANDATYGSGSPWDHINCNSPNGSTYDQSKKLCAEMKKAGIEVYTVGFLLVDSPVARDLLGTCATDASHFYVSDSGDKLKMAFRDIALKISSLYLSN